jgi:hypothetical protein
MRPPEWSLNFGCFAEIFEKYEEHSHSTENYTNINDEVVTVV